MSLLLSLSSNALITLFILAIRYIDCRGIIINSKWAINIYTMCMLDILICTHRFVSLLALFDHSITHELFMVYLAFIIERLKLTIVLTSFY